MEVVKNNMYDLLCIGNYTRDTIISPSGIRHVDGGAMNYSAHAANQLGLRVAVVTCLSREDQRVVDKFEDCGIDCYVVYTPESTTMRLEYPTSNPDLRYLSVASTAGSISSKDLEGIQTKAAVIGSSLRGEVDINIFPTLKKSKVLLGADMQGFVRVLRGQRLNYEPWGEMEAILPYLDVLKSDAVEAEFLTGEADIFKAASIFSQMGAKEIVLTHKDGLLLYAGGEFFPADFYPNSLIGRSGRGDTCIGAYMAKRISLNPYEAMLWAAAVTSLKMEKLGPFDCSINEVKELLGRKYHYVEHAPVN